MRQLRYRQKIEKKFTESEKIRVREKTVDLRLRTFDKDGQLTRSMVKKSLVSSSVKDIYDSHKMLSIILNLLNDLSLQEDIDHCFDGIIRVSNIFDDDKILEKSNTADIKTNDVEKFVEILRDSLKKSKEFKIKIKFTKLSKFKGLLNAIQQSVPDLSFQLRFPFIRDHTLYYDFVKKNNIIGSTVNADMSASFIFDSNFVIAKEHGNVEYTDVYQGFRTEAKSKYYIQERSFLLLQKELKGKYDFTDEKKLKLKFLGRVSQLEGENKELILNMAEIAFDFFDEFLNQIIDFRNYAKQKTSFQMNDFDRIEKSLCKLLEKQGYFCEKFCIENRDFFRKIWIDLETKGYKTPLLVDWMIVLYSMLINIYNTPSKCTVISDDKDISVIARIFADKIIPEVLARKFYFEYQNQFDNNKIFLEKIKRDGFEDGLSFYNRLRKKIDDVLMFSNNFYSDFYKGEIGIVYMPKNRILYTVYLSKLLIYYLQNITEMVNIRLNEIITCTILDLDLLDSKNHVRLKKMLTKRSKNGEIITGSKQELLDLL